MEPSRGASVRMALPALSLALGASLFVLLPKLALGPRYSSQAAFALAATAIAAVVALRSAHPRAGVAAGLGLLAWAPLLSVVSAYELSRPIFEPWTGGVRCGTGTMALFVFGSPVGVLVVLVLGLGGGSLLSLLARVRRVDRALRVLAGGALGLGVLVVALAAARADRADPDTYLAELTSRGPTAALAPGGRAEVAGRRFTYGDDPGTTRTSTRDCVLARQFGDSVSGTTSVQTLGPCPRLSFFVDRRADALFVRGTGESPPQTMDVALYRASTGATIVPTPEAVAPSLSPPVGWTVGAALSVLAACALLLAARHARRGARAAGALVDGEHVGGGRITAAGHEPFHLAAAEALPIGPVALDLVGEASPTYRVAPAPAVAGVRPGTAGDLKQAAMDRAASLTTAAFVSLVLGLTPLLVSRAFGLL